MKIVDTTSHLFDLYDERNDLTMYDLNHYYTQFTEVFEEYFQYHCPRTDERLLSAIERYPSKMEEMKLVAEQLSGIINDTISKFNRHFGLELDLTFNLLVGGFGSNAFVQRKIIGEVYFAVEKLSANPVHLQVIVAHEIGHVYHNALSDEVKMDWSKVDWIHGLTTLYREGVTTYISQQIVKGIPESVYFSYDDDGDEWQDYCIINHDVIVEAFLRDSKEWSIEKEREWFRLSGGSYFGYNRLGYYLGTCFVNQLVKEVGEKNAITFWSEHDIKDKVISWLEVSKARLLS